MKIACSSSAKLARFIGFSSSLGLWLKFTSTAFAQTATAGASKGGTSGALPNAGSTELTYAIFIGGAILFIVGALKLVFSYRE